MNAPNTFSPPLKMFMCSIFHFVIVTFDEIKSHLLGHWPTAERQHIMLLRCKMALGFQVAVMNWLPVSL